MLVGMPFSGKTTALKTLQKALTDLAQDCRGRSGVLGPSLGLLREIHTFELKPVMSS